MMEAEGQICETSAQTQPLISQHQERLEMYLSDHDGLIVPINTRSPEANLSTGDSAETVPEQYNSVSTSSLPPHITLPKTITIAPTRLKKKPTTVLGGAVVSPQTMTISQSNNPQIIKVPLPSKTRRAIQHRLTNQRGVRPASSQPATLLLQDVVSEAGLQLEPLTDDRYSASIESINLPSSSESAVETTVLTSHPEQIGDVSHQRYVSMSGCPVVINGESGVFLPNKSLQRDDVKVVVQKTYSFRNSKCDPTAVKSRRTIGISTDPSVPIEIGISHQVVSSMDLTHHSADSISYTPSGLFPMSLPARHSSTQTSSEDFYDFDAFREQYLPRSPKYSYNYTTIDEERSLIEFRVAGMTDKQTVNEWVRQLEQICNVCYRVWKTYKPKKEGAYKVDLRCHMNQGKNKKTVKGKNCGCQSMLSIIVDPKRLTRGSFNRAVRAQFRCKVRFRFVHNHSVEESLKYMPVQDKVREKILGYYGQGLSISDSYSRHYKDLKTEYGDRYYEIMCNRGLCPDKGYFYSLWKQFSKEKYGVVVKPPKPATPKVPWNKGLRGITSLKEFIDILPPEEVGGDGKKKKGGPTKRERIRRAALDGVDSTLMESIRQNPETYSRAVACFVEIWRSMDDKGRLAWLQTKIESGIPERVTLITTEPMNEEIEATENILEELAVGEHNYSDIVVTTEPSSKRIKLLGTAAGNTSTRELSEYSAAGNTSTREITEYSFELSESGVPFYRVTSL